jgi:hypothetical protein
MTPRTFWIIFIKILGLWLVLGSITVIPGFIGALSYYGKDRDMRGILIWVFMFLLLLGIFAGILWLFVFKTEWIIDKLRLDKGFTEEKIDVNIHRSTIINIAIIVFGGLMLIDALPLLLKEVIQYYQEKEAYNRFTPSPRTGWLFLYFLKVIIGYFLVTYSRVVVNLIERQRKKH